MEKIKLITEIKAPIERVFDLSRSIDLHKSSTKGTNEEAIEGRTEGLIKLGESVTWRAKHFGVYQKLTVEIINFESPNMFEDVMLKGTFKSMKHIHSFKSVNGKTIMTDEFEFESPFGFLGKIIDSLILKNYMTNFLKIRNKEIKETAEGKLWMSILGN